jgi:hypothetical protein
VSLRTRVLACSVVSLVAIGGATAYALNLHSKRQAQVKQSPRLSQTSVAQIQAEPHIVFRNTALGPDYGKVAMVGLSDPGGPRAIVDAPCERVYAAAQKLLCLSANRGVVTTYKAEILGADLSLQEQLPLAGAPSRGRLSNDATLAATTSFTAGDSYTSNGFSTRTVISSLLNAGERYNLETFHLIDNKAEIRPVSRNFWGVTFAKNDDDFYATVAFNGKTWLVKGSVRARSVAIVHTDAECPSLSPDGRRVVYKKRLGKAPGIWRLASLDLATGVERLLEETRSVDDQVEWLDNHQVLYGIPRTGSQAATDDVYALPVDGTGTPRLLIQQAWSPAVVR